MIIFFFFFNGQLEPSGTWTSGESFGIPVNFTMIAFLLEDVAYDA